MFGQGTLLGGGEPQVKAGFDGLRRTELGEGAWLDVCPEWLEGDATLYDELAERLAWRQPEVVMYERKVTTPRLVATPELGAAETLVVMSEALTERYRVPMRNVSVNWYRDGSDSVAWHGDRVARELNRSVVAVLSLRGPREFRYRPAAGGPSASISAGHGDLVVMGGSFQRTWRHAVPKCASAPPRMAVMIRHDYEPATLRLLGED